jgi:hypothetical protein
MRRSNEPTSRKRRTPGLTGLPQSAAGLFGAAGLVGAAVGLIAGLLFSHLLAGLSVRPSATALSLIGLLIFGVAIGLVVFIIRRRAQGPTLEVHWSPQEVTTVGLSGRPVTVGGGADDIVLRGAPPRVSTIVMENGVLAHIETSTGERTPLQDGSRLRIGGLVMVVHAPR